MTMNEHVDTSPLCKVTFKRSSSSKGEMGYDIEVSHGCEAAEAHRIYELALDLKLQADEALRPKSLEESLAESLR